MSAVTEPQEQTDVHPMSDYEKFMFDLKGFLVIPSVLTDEEIEMTTEPGSESVSKMREPKNRGMSEFFLPFSSMPHAPCLSTLAPSLASLFNFL